MWSRLLNMQDKPVSLEELQYRIAVIFVLLTFAAIVIFGFTDHLLGLNPILGKIRLVYGLVFAFLFVLMIKYQRVFLAMNLMLGLILTFSFVNYYFNDGFQGPTIFNLFVFVVAISIFFKKPLNILWWSSAVLGYLLLFYFEIEGMIVVSKNYDSPQSLYWDNAISIFLCAIFIFIGIYFLIINYQKQQERLMMLQKENEKNLADLTSLNLKKNELIALLSHDLRGPISTLGATLELVDEGVLDENDLNLILPRLKSQSFQLSQVLNNTLAWVSAEMENTVTEKQPTDLAKLGEIMKETMEVQAQNKGQTIVFELIGANKTVLLESKEVKIILKNLMDNAIKFTKPGETIKLILKVENEKIRWEVKNPGELIAENLRASLFDFKVKSSLGTQKEKGTGIGLTLCKKIAESLEMRLGYLTENQQNIFFLEIDMDSSQYHTQALGSMSAND
jgi:two-component system, sensor histidine kinase and response regulator